MSVPIVSSFDDFAEAMAVPNPNRPIQEGVAAFGRRVCDRISARPDIYAPTILQSPLVAACTPYWNSQGYDAPVEETPFNGGQCSGVIYEIWGETWQPFSAVWGPFERLGGSLEVIQGPVLTLEVQQGSLCSAGGFEGKQTTIVATGGVDGTAVLSFSRGCVADGPGGVPGIRNLQPIRQDGQPDDCGDPPSTYVPGTNPAPDPGPLPPDTGPTINVRGNPIVILPPTLEVSPNVNVTLSPGEFNFGGAAGDDATEVPFGGVEEVGAGSGAGGGDNQFGDPPPGERWAGCCVNVTARPQGSGTIPQAEPQSIYPNTVGNVRLIFASSQGSTNYDTPLTKRQKTTCVWEPVRGLAPIGVRVNLLPGYSYTYRPYSVPLEQ